MHRRIRSAHNHQDRTIRRLHNTDLLSSFYQGRGRQVKEYTYLRTIWVYCKLPVAPRLRSESDSFQSINGTKT
uniref:AlNc14C56G4267 protein n=1 Tax=Albugo laibachii Nc14 TaxID=890382 RepID=F0WC84_9STRA|nr:AlNc14C56G4267 [Albugo laibachii Nc14]|eukprot:CCA18797.1 AlNc14C56G4267 [Albugo laibachii Nc14]